MLMCSCIILFALCSFLGWAWESVYAVATRGKWENRGFLYGPVCPIYGIGVVTIVLVAKALLAMAGMDYHWYHILLVAFFGSMILEYIVSWGLEKAFHAYWWNYDDMPLNINGRTCIPAGCLFALGGLAAVYVVSPLWDAMTSHLSLPVIQLMAFAVVILFTIDFTLTISALTSFARMVKAFDDAFNAHASEVTDKITASIGSATGRIHPVGSPLHEESMQHLVNSMNYSTQSALRRIDGLKVPVHPTRPHLHVHAHEIHRRTKHKK